MTASLSRWSAPAFVIGLFAVLASGCVVPGGGYGEAGYGVDYYGPSGIDYGGWGAGYYVAPYRDRDHHPEGREGRGGRESPPAYRAAPPSHAIPSLPSGSRSSGGGGRGGGGGGRGGGGSGHR